jgi:very-short-patch-repair endonuclease
MANQSARWLRGNQTEAEKALWRVLRPLKEQGFHFRRQVPIDHFIVDFACLSRRLVIEVDGGQHGMRKGEESDLKRDAYLTSQGFRVLRFWNNDVLNNRDGVMQRVLEALNEECET